MKRLLPFLAAGTLTFALGFSGCYTQFVTVDRHSSDYPVYDTPDYAETYTDSTGNIVNNNYYFDDRPHFGAYFSYYYPTRWSAMWSYYDPWNSWGYGPGWYDPWSVGYWDPWWGYSTGMYVGLPYYRYNYWDGYWYNPYWNRQPIYSYQNDGRRRPFGTTRSFDDRVRNYGMTRSLYAPAGGAATSPSSIRAIDRTRGSDGAFDRISTRNRERTPSQSDPAIRNDAGKRARERRTTDNPPNLRNGSESGRQRNYTPPSDSRVRERPSSTPSYSPPPSRESAPARGGGNSGGGRSSSGSSNGGSSSGRSRSR